MATFKVKVVSQTNAAVLIIILLIVFIGSVFLFMPHGIHNTGLALMFTVACLIIGYFLWQRFVTGRTEWTIDGNEVDIKWTKKFPFTEGKEIVLKWVEVKKISKGIDPHYYNLKIKLVTGRTIKFYHDYMTTGDDFEECLKTLLQIFTQKNPQPGTNL